MYDFYSLEEFVGHGLDLGSYSRWHGSLLEGWQMLPLFAVIPLDEGQGTDHGNRRAVHRQLGGQHCWETQGMWLASEGRLLGGGSMLSWWIGYGLSEKVIKDDAKILAWFGGECTRQLFSLLYVQLITYWQTWLLAKNRNRNTLNDSLEMEKHGFSSLIFDLLLVLFEQLEFPFW